MLHRQFIVNTYIIKKIRFKANNPSFDFRKQEKEEIQSRQTFRAGRHEVIKRINKNNS